jgi:hypothetical protein
VKAHDVRCPFCAAAMPAPARPPVAAAMVIGLGLAVGGCSSSSAEPMGTDAAYGGPPHTRDAGHDARKDVHPLASDAYGAPADVHIGHVADTGKSHDAKRHVDAPKDTGPMISDAYGAPADVLVGQPVDATPMGGDAYAPPPEWSAGSGPEGA